MQTVNPQAEPCPNEAQSADTDRWQRLADLCRAHQIPVRRGARWAQTQNDTTLAQKRPRPAGGSPEWWVSDAGAEAFGSSIRRPESVPNPSVPASDGGFWWRLRRCFGG